MSMRTLPTVDLGLSYMMTLKRLEVLAAQRQQFADPAKLDGEVDLLVEQLGDILVELRGRHEDAAAGELRCRDCGQSVENPLDHFCADCGCHLPDQSQYPDDYAYTDAWNAAHQPNCFFLGRPTVTTTS